MLRFLILSWMICTAGSLSAGKTAVDLAFELTTRYAPYANWQAVVDVELLAEQDRTSYWRTAAELRANRDEEAQPLAGLHLALDPGHVGGRWAPFEARDFVIEEGDFRVREGELVLEVAHRIRAQLEAAGAQVTLLREGFEPINPRTPFDYLETAIAQVQPPEKLSVESFLRYSKAVQNRAVRQSVVIGEIAERAEQVNRVIQPDALLSLHVNAAQWPRVVDGEPVEGLHLVESNHVHVLIFGCMSDGELQVPRQQEQLAAKLLNGSGAEERLLGKHIGDALVAETGLEASLYSRNNAVLLDSDTPSLWARNLLLLRMVECPTVLLEPYVANSEAVYPRIQSALKNRAENRELAEDDILVEYANAVVRGVFKMYATTSP